MNPGDAVKFRYLHGSVGRIESANHYGGFYVRWNFGRDVKGESIKSLSSVRADELVEIPQELYDQYVRHRAWSDAQKEVGDAINLWIVEHHA